MSTRAEPEKFCSITVDTGLCSFDEATAHAVELAQQFAFVTFQHGSMSVRVRSDWSAVNLRVAWNYAVLVSQGRGLLQ